MKAIYVIIAIQVFSILVSIAAIVFLIVRRVRKKKQENFEKRDN
jgi:preprotein translocase subunit YajC